MLAAENSSVVAEENDYGRLAGPQGTKPYFLAIGIGEHDFCQFAAERLFHDGSI
jgi:hypothetical protein